MVLLVLTTLSGLILAGVLAVSAKQVLIDDALSETNGYF